MRILIEGQSAALSARLEAALTEVERRFGDELVSDLDCVNTLARHLEQYRGKMLRPTLVLLCEAATGQADAPSDAALTLATVVEMVHMATLVHDDVLDDQELRRRGTTINTLHGNEAAVMLGDYLISHAYHLCSSLGSQEAARLVARSTNTVCEGELLQLAHRNRFDITEPIYFDIIHRKTAALCGVACRLGVMSAPGNGADAATADAAAAYGEALGSAFQIVDDVLDLTGDAAIVGKSLGKDLAKGKLTLPLIHRLSVADDAEREWLIPALTAATEADASRLGQHVAASDSLAYAQATAQRLVDDAKSRLAPWPDSDAKSLLHAMADAVIDRRF